MIGEPVKITLTFTPAAWALLTAMTAYDEHETVEACIMASLATDVESFVEGINAYDHTQELFLSGEVIVPDATARAAKVVKEAA